MNGGTAPIETQRPPAGERGTAPIETQRPPADERGTTPIETQRPLPDERGAAPGGSADSTGSAGKTGSTGASQGTSQPPPVAQAQTAHKFPTFPKLSENNAVSCQNRRELPPFFAYFSFGAGPRRRRNAKFRSFRIKFAEKAPDFKKSTGKGAFPVENSASNLIRVSKTAQNLETDGSLCRKSVEKRKKFLFSISEDGEI